MLHLEHQCHKIWGPYESLGRSNHKIKTKYCQPDRYWYNITEVWHNEPAFLYSKRWVLPGKETDMIRIHADFDYCRHFGDLREPGGTAALYLHIHIHAQ